MSRLDADPVQRAAGVQCGKVDAGDRDGSRRAGSEAAF